jgi:hypothetical protein
MYHKVVHKCIQSEPVHCFCALLYIICALYNVSFPQFFLNPSVSQTLLFNIFQSLLPPAHHGEVEGRTGSFIYSKSLQIKTVEISKENQ